MTLNKLKLFSNSNNVDLRKGAISTQRIKFIKKKTTGQTRFSNVRQSFPDAKKKW
jgi:hypothetical protein